MVLLVNCHDFDIKKNSYSLKAEQFGVMNSLPDAMK